MQLVVLRYQKCILLNGQRAVLRLSSYLCAEHTKIVKSAAEEQAESASNRMSFRVLPDRGEVLCTRGKHAPANKGILER